MTEGGIQKRVRHGNVDGFQLTQFSFMSCQLPKHEMNVYFLLLDFYCFKPGVTKLITTSCKSTTCPSEAPSSLILVISKSQ